MQKGHFSVAGFQNGRDFIFISRIYRVNALKFLQNNEEYSVKVLTN